MLGPKFRFPGTFVRPGTPARANLESVSQPSLACEAHQPFPAGWLLSSRARSKASRSSWMVTSPVTRRSSTTTASSWPRSGVRPSSKLAGNRVGEVGRRHRRGDLPEPRRGAVRVRDARQRPRKDDPGNAAAQAENGKHGLPRGQDNPAGEISHIAPRSHVRSREPPAPL